MGDLHVVGGGVGVGRISRSFRVYGLGSKPKLMIPIGEIVNIYILLSLVAELYRSTRDCLGVQHKLRLYGNILKLYLFY